MAPADLQEACSWIQLLNPQSDADVRASIISYGELAQAAYDGFNSDEGSPHAGSCIYSTANLLAASGVSHPGRYRVTKFVYATAGQSAALTRVSGVVMPQVTDALFVFPAAEEEKSTLPESNWMGYVAVATEQGAAALGRRDIVVGHREWRGLGSDLDHGDGRGFQLVVDRDVALVNKGTNALKDEYPVPEKWWVTNNKCKAKGIVGRWKLQNLNNNN